jgi:hypothetical protein
VPILFARTLQVPEVDEMDSVRVIEGPAADAVEESAQPVAVPLEMSRE